MKVIDSTAGLQQHRSLISSRVGFVPTMGNLHLGHISLLDRALKENDDVYFSIFVNPTQFGPGEDFSKYPRTLQDDLKLIEKKASEYPGKGVIVFAPKSPEEIYPSTGIKTVTVPDLKHILEGEFRPTHFDGVTTVVYRLFDLVRPLRSYFGLKDYQQYVIIKQMVQQEKLAVEIIGMPIIREADGLAMSSRNQYLTPDQRRASLILYQSLSTVLKLLNHDLGNLPKARALMKELENDPNWNYLELRDSETLSEDVSRSKQVTILGVYQFGSTRLLDNMQMEIK
jgi:pantoate--beta-alanine ligase